MDIDIVRNRGRMSLKGNWNRAILVFLIIGGTSFTITMCEETIRTLLDIPVLKIDDITGNIIVTDLWRAESILLASLNMLVSFLIISPMKLKQYRIYWELSEGSTISANRQNGIKTYLRSLLMSASMDFLMFFSGSVLLVPGAALLFIGFGGQESHGISAFFGIVSGCILLFAGLLVWCFLCASFFLIPYIVAGNKNTSVFRAVLQSVKWSKGVKTGIFGLYFSFVPLFISCIAVIPLFYVFPLFQTSKAHMARQIIKNRVSSDRERDLERTKEVVLPII